MEAKEKAKELFTTFSADTVHYYSAKNCALKAVNEIMKAVGWNEMVEGVDRDTYWDDVKEEINKL